MPTRSLCFLWQRTAKGSVFIYLLFGEGIERVREKRERVGSKMGQKGKTKMNEMSIWMNSHS